MTRDAAFSFHGRVFVNKRSLLVCVTLDASGVGAGRESRLFQFETAMRIVAIAALHRAFQHLVMKRQVELVLRLRMATETELWLARLEQLQIGEPGLLRVGSRDEHIRRRELTPAGFRVRRVTVSATDVVAPVLAAPEVVVFFPASMTGQTRFRDLFRRFVFERDDLLRIAFFTVRLAWTMTRLATRHLLLPTGKRGELRVRSVREGFELIFVAVFTSGAADVVFRLVSRGFGLIGLN